MIESDVFLWISSAKAVPYCKNSQAWPLVIPSLPELSGKAAYYQSQVYTLETVKEVISYANAIGIEVMLEIDTYVEPSLCGRPYTERKTRVQTWSYCFYRIKPSGSRGLHERSLDSSG